MTSLLGGRIVPKDHPRLEAYGTLDELNCWIGLLRDYLGDHAVKDHLLGIQDRLMAGSSILAAEGTEDARRLPSLREEDVGFLEERIDEMVMQLPPLSAFIFPGGHPVVSICHLARAICRRAERHSAQFAKDSRQAALLTKYLNRLSDYLFTLARKIAADFTVDEIPWQPGL